MKAVSMFVASLAICSSAYASTLISDTTKIETSEEKKEVEQASLSFSGYLDTYYFTNLNRPSTRTNLGSSGISRGFDRNVDQFQLGMLLFQMKYSYKNVQLISEVGYGPNVEYGSYGSDFRYKWGTVLANSTYTAIMIKQAYVNFDATSKLSFTIGQFGTPIGYEYIDAPLNFHYSINNTFNAGIPFYHVGLKATYKFSDKVALMSGIVNGTDNHNDNNRGKSYIGQLFVSPAQGLNIYLNTIQGNEANARGDGSDTTSYFGVLDLVATYQITKKLMVGTWLMYGSLKGENQGGTYFTSAVHWRGANFYTVYEFSKIFSLGARLEYFDNKSGARALLTHGQGTDVVTFTVTGNFKLADERLLLKPELRVDSFDKTANGENGQQFVDSNGSFSKNSQTTIGMAAIFKF